MPAQAVRNSVQDEFQLEINRMRNSLSALALKNFMFDGVNKNGNVGGVMEGKKTDPSKVEKQAQLEPKEEKSSLVKPSSEASVEPNHLRIEIPLAVKSQLPVIENQPVSVNQKPSFPSESKVVIVEQHSFAKPAVSFATHPTALARQSFVSTEFSVVEPPKEVSYRRSLSKHRQETTRTQSKSIDPSDVIIALTLSQENINENKPKATRVHFAEAKLMVKEPSRDSDEVAKINNESEMPWQKKHHYRTVTPFFKPQNKTKAISSENIAVDLSFRPIETSRSTEDITKAVLKPVPVFASKSYQELPRSYEFKPFDEFQTKSSDDLLMDNIDGVRKPESKRHKLLRIRSTSNNSLNRYSDQLVYENFHYEFPEIPMSADNVKMRKKAPQPLPRSSDDLSKRHSKTVVYVLDKERDEFVLESPLKVTEQNLFDEVYEDVLLRNNVTRDSDSTMFYSLVDSRDDRKFLQIYLLLSADG